MKTQWCMGMVIYDSCEICGEVKCDHYCLNTAYDRLIDYKNSHGCSCSKFQIRNSILSSCFIFALKCLIFFSIFIHMNKYQIQLRIDRNFCSVHEELTSIRLCKGVYSLIEIISNEPNK